jgi:hypothetical protein
MSFIGGFSDANYYEYDAGSLCNDSTFTVGVVAGIGNSDTGASQVLFSNHNGTGGYEIRTAGDTFLTSSGPLIQAQAGVITLSAQLAPVAPVFGINRVLFICLAANASGQFLYVNGNLLARGESSAIATGWSGPTIGAAHGGVSPAEDSLINMAFYTNDKLEQSEIQTMFKWLMGYGRLPANGVLGAGWDIDHFWDLFDSRDAASTEWDSRGARTTASTLDLNGTLSIASTGTASWGL